MNRTAPFVTLTYKRIYTGEKVVHLKVDIYPPSSIASSQQSVPAVVYFHGGGLTCGNRQGWVPTWLQERVAAAGYAYISPDYQLIPPATGHDILADIRDVMAFISKEEIILPPPNLTTGALPKTQPLQFKIDPMSIAIVGSSAASVCAYLAAMHCVCPKPKAILSIYGMGGNFLTPQYLSPKTKPFFFGKELLDPNDFPPWLHAIHFPNSSLNLESLQPIAESPLLFHPDFPNKPAHPRMVLILLYIQLGIYLDYYTGSFENGGLSGRLRKALGLEGKTKEVLQQTTDAARAVDSISELPPWEFDDGLRSLIPPTLLDLFPQFGVTKEWPPTMLVHGTCDSLFPIEESRLLAKKLKAVGVKVQLCEVEGRDHAFDYRPRAEEESGYVFAGVMDFLKQHLEGEV